MILSDLHSARCRRLEDLAELILRDLSIAILVAGRHEAFHVGGVLALAQDLRDLVLAQSVAVGVVLEDSFHDLFDSVRHLDFYYYTHGPLN